jgi:hypothetical protein
LPSHLALAAAAHLADGDALSFIAVTEPTNPA